MKKLFLLVLLAISIVSIAQEKNVINDIKKIKNKELAKAFATQDIVFDEIENFLISEEINKNDSLQSSIEKLSESYNSISKNNSAFYALKLNKKEFELLDNYYIYRLQKIDSLYKPFLTKQTASNKQKTDESKTTKVEETKVENTTIEETKIIESAPSHESCINSELDVNKCFQNIILNKVRNNYNVPEYRTIGVPQLKLFLNLNINKTGKLETKNILRSSGYFEYDMEAVRVMSIIKKNITFIPAYSNGKPVNCLYVIPINVAIIED
ncbi:MAG: energy transducer TonB [Flavobacterium sp.]|uniref:energy transducer TonB n=1 Tax=Flavobacterium sp. TaxID=239 RepID=UPI0037B3B023